ncbi:MAG: lipid II flippase MurJ, partial [Chloroflexota bacterium]
PAKAGALFNASIVIVTLALAPIIGIRAAAFGWLIGSIAQFALQLPGLRGSRLRLSFQWNHPGLRYIGRLYIPVSFSLIIDTLVVRFFSYRLANDILETGVVYMDRATTLIQLPQGLVATAISIAILPTLSQQAAALLKPDGESQPFKNTLGLGLRLAIVLILPATVGLFVLANPIVGLLFEHGQFTAADTGITVTALRLYLLGLPFAAIDLLLVYAFYARQDTLTPALIGVVSLTVYMIVALATAPTFGLYSLMIADSVKHLLHAFISGYLLVRQLNGTGNQRLILTLSRALVAASLMGAAAYGLLAFSVPSSGSTLAEVGFVLVSGSISGAVFIGVAYALRIEELRWLVSLVQRRMGNR